MPAGIFIGLTVFVLEIAGLAWLAHTYVAPILGKSEHWLLIAVGAGLGVLATALAVASVVVASRADDQMDAYIARKSVRKRSFAPPATTADCEVTAPASERSRRDLALAE